MIHQASKPFKIAQVLNLLCSRQKPPWMNEAPGCQPRLTCSVSGVLSHTALRPELQMCAQRAAVGATLLGATMGGTITAASIPLPPALMAKDSGEDSMLPAGYTVPADTPNGPRNLFSGNDQSMSISGN